MNSLTELLQSYLQSPAGILSLVASLVITLCAVVVFGAVFVNFMTCRRAGGGVKQERRSVVATGSMTLFFVGYYLLIKFRVGELPLHDFTLRLIMAGVGLGVIVFGCAVNVAGRFWLGRNWANQATIYEGQRLVTSGVYGWVRHPLYASIIWMFYGASLVYANAGAFLVNTLIFIPFMVYRARLEEAMLAREFREYGDYRRRVGMFFWKWPASCGKKEG